MDGAREGDPRRGGVGGRGCRCGAAGALTVFHSLFSSHRRPRASLPPGGPWGFWCCRPGQPCPYCGRAPGLLTATFADTRLLFQTTGFLLTGGLSWCSRPPRRGCKVGRGRALAWPGVGAVSPAFAHVWTLRHNRFRVAGSGEARPRPGPPPPGGRGGVHPCLSGQVLSKPGVPQPADVSVRGGLLRMHRGGPSLTTGSGSRLPRGRSVNVLIQGLVAVQSSLPALCPAMEIWA